MCTSTSLQVRCLSWWLCFLNSLCQKHQTCACFQLLLPSRNVFDSVLPGFDPLIQSVAGFKTIWESGRGLAGEVGFCHLGSTSRVFTYESKGIPMEQKVGRSVILQKKNETNAYKCYGMQKRGHCHWWISEYIPQPPTRKKSMNLVLSIAHRIHGTGIFTLHVG